MELTAYRISKEFGGNTVLQDVSLTVSSGTMLAVLGPSGRGKSTLLSILGLLLDPTEGDVLLEGESILGLSDGEAAEVRNRRFGFLFQDTQLVESLRVLDNVLVPALLARERGLENRARDLLEQFGLADRMQHFPYQLSIGQRRRVSLARALLLGPDFIFADEPTNDLDEENAALVEDALVRMRAQGAGIVLVTHDMRFAGKADSRYALD